MGGSERSHNFALGEQSASMAQELGAQRTAELEPLFMALMGAAQGFADTAAVQGTAQPGTEFMQGAANRTGQSGTREGQRNQLGQQALDASANVAEAGQNSELQAQGANLLAAVLQAQQQIPLAQMGAFTQGADFSRQQAASSVGNAMGLGQGLGSAAFDLLGGINLGGGGGTPIDSSLSHLNPNYLPGHLVTGGGGGK